ncbi:MAG TPA: polyamine ABC transporter ATP-binding protein [Arthrobacter bacterium]|nr:polyamine ABC transporter ATP-binding protein [Arthrobacter sp.]HBH56811.1 polyamine ABC transporter ATP-binding protein [Arthrobacter sp.]HCC40472.1 polyamine ABC transporter ATP-binding protein [Arthrobacter sp.]HCN21367.1 polyamine ABC transporter ATP-binding protein [Arthrobacter sp.]
MTTSLISTASSPSPGTSTSPGTAPKGTIELRNVTKTYGDVVAVDRLDLMVQPGEFVTLLGPSGSGKTTTMMMVAGFEEHTGGSVLIDGQPVDRLPPRERNLGVVFQNYALFPHMSALENVEFALRMRKIPRNERRKRAEEALDRVGLGKMGDRKPRQLSGGQQQRVALARALVFNPAALLLDEPMAALDKRLREQMQEEIKTLQKSLGISVLFVTHDQDEAMAMSDRIVVMKDGRIVQSGAPEEVYNEPLTDWVASFLGDTNLIPCTVLERDGQEVLVDLGCLGTARMPDRGVTGDKYAVSIRPEHLKFRSSATEGNGGAARLESSTNLGATVRHRLTAGGLDLQLRELSSDAADRPVPGSEVFVGWTPGRAQLLVLEQ